MYTSNMGMRWLIALGMGMLLFGRASIAKGQVQSPPSSNTVKTVYAYNRADIIERFDADGYPLPTPRKLVIEGLKAGLLALEFPELEISPPPKGEAAVAGMRLDITLTRSDGQVTYLYLDPALELWWDGRTNQRYHVSHSTAVALTKALKTAKDDPSLLPKSPVVRAEIVDTMHEQGGLLIPPTKTVITGERAAAVATSFPELGLTRQRHMGGTGGGGRNRFYILFVRENGEETRISVNGFEMNFKGDSVWSEGNRSWLLGEGVLVKLNALVKGAAGDPTAMDWAKQPSRPATQPWLTQPRRDN